MIGTPSALLACEASLPSLFDRAVTHCARRRGETSPEILRRLRAGDPETHSTFRYALAKGIGEYLGGLGISFHAVYVHGSAMGDAASPCSDIDIVVVVGHRRDEIERLLGLLDVGLVTCFRMLLPQAKAMRSLLDVRIVESGEATTDGQSMTCFPGIASHPVCLWRAEASARATPERLLPRRRQSALMNSCRIRDGW